MRPPSEMKIKAERRLGKVCVGVCVCVRECVRASLRACVRARARARVHSRCVCRGGMGR